MFFGCCHLWTDYMILCILLFQVMVTFVIETNDKSDHYFWLLQLQW